MGIGEWGLLGWIWLANAVAALLYLLIGLLLSRRSGGDARKVQISFVIFLLCPVAAFLFAFFSWLLYMFLFRDRADLEDVIFRKDKVQAISRPNLEMESNFVPLEEALAVSDNGSLRGLMLDVLKGDVDAKLGSISRALSGRDPETAHYAASALRDALNDFREQAGQRYQALQSGSTESIEEAGELIEYIGNMLGQKVFSPLEQKAFVDMVEDVGEMVYLLRPHLLQPRHMEIVAGGLLEVGDWGRCRIWCDRAMERFPQELCAYTLSMRLLFAQGKGEELSEVISALRRSDIVMDQAALEWIRTFEQAPRGGLE